jgi:hypothetical protein
LPSRTGPFAVAPFAAFAGCMDVLSCPLTSTQHCRHTVVSYPTHFSRSTHARNPTRQTQPPRRHR